MQSEENKPQGQDEEVTAVSGEEPKSDLDSLKPDTENPMDVDSEASARLAQMELRNNELNDKYLRLYSEFDNYRRRTAKERLDLMKSAGEDVFKLLLPVLDDFDRAMASMEKATEVAAVREGVVLIHQKLTKELGGRGLRPFDPKGEVFDPEVHEAVTQFPASDDMKGKVVDVLERGYTLNDKVIRFAKVVVGA
jgi:molecular chaperone GrpE